MEKLNIVWIKKWKIKRNLISVMTKIKAFFEKRNWNYVAIIAIIFGGAVVVYTSCWINDSDRRKYCCWNWNRNYYISISYVISGNYKCPNRAKKNYKNIKR